MIDWQVRDLADRIDFQDRAELGQFDCEIPGEAPKYPSAPRTAGDKAETAEAGQELLEFMLRHIEHPRQFGDR